MKTSWSKLVGDHRTEPSVEVPTTADEDGDSTNDFCLLDELAWKDSSHLIAVHLDVPSLCRLSQTSRTWRTCVADDMLAWRTRARELGLEVVAGNTPDHCSHVRKMIREAWTPRIGDVLEALDTCGTVGTVRVLATVDDPGHGPLLLLGFEGRGPEWHLWLHRVHDCDRLRPLRAVTVVDEITEDELKDTVHAAQQALLRPTSTWQPPCGNRHGRWPWLYAGGASLKVTLPSTHSGPSWRPWLATQTVRPFQTATQLAADPTACASMWLAATAPAARNRPARFSELLGPWPPPVMPDGLPQSTMQFHPVGVVSRTAYYALASVDACRGQRQRQRQGRREWQIGDRCEARDHCGQWYVARIASILRETGYVYVHFEGWEDRWDEYHATDALTLRPYTGLQRFGDRGSEEHSQRWATGNTAAAPAHGPTGPPPFEIGQRVEAQDLVGDWYVARIVDSLPHNHWRLRVHFVGWSDQFDEWHDAAAPTLRPYAGLQRFGPLGPMEDAE